MAEVNVQKGSFILETGYGKLLVEPNSIKSISVSYKLECPNVVGALDPLEYIPLSCMVTLYLWDDTNIYLRNSIADEFLTLLEEQGIGRNTKVS